VVEHHLAKVGVAGSSPVFRFFIPLCGALAQLGERLLCTQEVIGSIPIGSIKASRFEKTRNGVLFYFPFPFEIRINIQKIVELSHGGIFIYNNNVIQRERGGR
jgi:hypothetical protein